MVLGLAVLGTPAGAVVGALAAPVSVLIVRHAQRRGAAIAPDRSLALALDLAAAVLRSGRPVPDALMLAAPAARPAARDALLRTARLLALGAEPTTAWAASAGAGSVLAPVAEVAIRSHASGVRLADSFERLAAQLRKERSTAALERAHRCGVQAMAPLAACFLPSFVCLGIVPVVAGVAATVLRAGLP